MFFFFCNYILISFNFLKGTCMDYKDYTSSVMSVSNIALFICIHTWQDENSKNIYIELIFRN